MLKLNFALPSYKSLQIMLGLLWLAVIGHSVANQWLDPQLPAQIQTAVLSYPTHHQAMLAGAMGLVVLFFASILLLLKKDLGRWLFLIGILLILIHDYFYGPQAKYALPQLFEDPGYLLLGMIVALSWSQPVNTLFSSDPFNLAILNTLKIICGILLLVFVISIFSIILTSASLPRLFQDFNITHQPPKILLIGYMVYLLSYIISIFCLFFRCNFARYSFPIAALVNVLLLQGANAYSGGWSYIFDRANILLAGLVMMLLFCEPLVTQFTSYYRSVGKGAKRCARGNDLSISPEKDNEDSINTQQKQDNINSMPNSDVPAQFYSTSIIKLCLLTLLFGSWYRLYWWYKNWRYIQKRDRPNIVPIWRSFFGPMFYYNAFLLDLKSQASIKGGIDFPYKTLLCVFAIFYIAAFGYAIYSAPAYYSHQLTINLLGCLFVIQLLSLLPFSLAQLTINKLNKDAVIIKEKTPKWQLVLLIIFGVFIAFGYCRFIFNYTLTTYYPQDKAFIL